MKPTLFNNVWRETLWALLHNGDEVRPRNQLTVELPQRTIVVDTRYPVLTVPERKLSYTFMAAEADWILSGDDRVETIAPYNAKMAEYSDDGKTFFGAYGPLIILQMEYVINKLRQDRDTRQAGLTTWRPNPPCTKDVPCTVAIFFNIRNNYLNSHVFMRSNDAWLGMPYDVFNFSMLVHAVCASLNEFYKRVDDGDQPVEPGRLYLTAASSHLYEQHFEAARTIVFDTDLPPDPGPTPEFMHQDAKAMSTCLKQLRGSKPGDPIRWWEGDVL